MLPRWFYSLQFRLTAGFAAALALSLTGVSLYSAQATSHEIKRFDEEVNEAKATRVEQLVSDTYREINDWTQVQRTLEQAGTLLGWRLMMTDDHGEIVADSHPAFAQQFPRMTARHGSQMPIMIGDSFIGSLLLGPDRPGRGSLQFSAAFVEARLRQLAPADVELLASPPTTSGTTDVSAPPTQEVYAAQEVPIEPPLDRLAASFQNSLLFAGLAAGAGGILIVSLGTRRALAPVRALTTAARSLGSGDLSQRVPTRGRDEVGELGNTFNEMAGALEQMERQRRTMTADIAHELRTPLSNVQGYLEAIMDGVVAPDTVTIETLHEQTLHLSRLVEDLRLTATAEAGALHLERSPLHVEDVAEETVEAFRTRASERGVHLDLEARPNLPEVTADRTRLHQIVANLLENALTHTPRGGNVTVAVGRAGTGWLRLEVADTGPGIPPDRLPHVFEQFYRVDPSRSRETGGAGLGLTIVKRLAEAHGGRVSAESEVGRGTRISVELPVPAESVV